MPKFQEIGIYAYYYDLERAGGKLRSEPEDFYVEELINDISRVENGNYLILKIMAKNWEHNRLVKFLARSMGISPKRIGFAGTKDRRALKVQYFSFHGIKFKNIHLEDFKVLDHFYSDRGIHLGDHRGNYFKIKIANSDSSTLKKNVEVLKSSKIFPNFYGPQRFGNLRPVSHMVGRDIVKRNYRDAVIKFVGMPGEDNFTEIRNEFYSDPDPSKFADKFPEALDLERSILTHLKYHPNDFMGAIKKLPPNLVSMFIHAYQAYLFNKILSERIQISKGIEVGDIVNDQGKLIKVNSMNYNELSKRFMVGLAFPTALIIGFGQEYSGGIEGEIEKKIMEEEGISFVDFKLPFNLSSRGERRNIYAIAKEINFEDNVISFTLPPGSYATSLLRELIREEDMSYY